MLTKIVQGEFNAHDITQGSVYYHQGAVEWQATQDECHHFQVIGNAAEPYDVYVDCIALLDRDLDVACSCPRFDEMGACKHLWAAILAIDAMQISLPSRPKRARLVPLSAEGMAANFDDWDEENADDGPPRSTSSAPPFSVSSLIQKAKQVMQEAKGISNAAASPPGGATAQPSTQPAWERSLEAVRSSLPRLRPVVAGNALYPWYAINVARSLQERSLAIDLFERTLLADGQWSPPKRSTNRNHLFSMAPTAFERDLSLQMWDGELDRYSWNYARRPAHELKVGEAQAERLLPRLAATGRLVWLLRGDQPWEAVRPVTWDAVPFDFVLTASRAAEKGGWLVRGGLTHGPTDPVELAEDVVLTSGSLVVFPDRVGMLADGLVANWIARTAPAPWHVPDEHRGRFLTMLTQVTPPPATRFPAEFCSVVTCEPVPILKVDFETKVKGAVAASVEFEYGTARIAGNTYQETLVDEQEGILYARNTLSERRFVSQLQQMKVHANGYWDGYSALRILAPEFSALLRTLADAGWVIEADQKKLRVGGQLKLNVTSSSTTQIDWFDLDGQVEFADSVTSLPKLLSAIRQGERTIRLDDGSIGLMSDEWLKQFGRLADLGGVEEGKIRFQSSQALLLDALLSSDEKATVDTGFRKVRERLQKTHKVKAISEPKGFGTKLRDYQKTGQGWLSCLHDLSLGGCLADDMGLGKTVQVLSWLETLRIKNQKTGAEHRPSLVVVPKSLVFNWVAEAAKFAPQLRVLNFTGKERTGLDDLSATDLVVTTYGTMRLEIEKLREIDFDYLILDEAQAIKNSNAQAAKAARLLKGRHRLAMSGTPIENHIGELWSLFEFINPGLLGNSTAFQRVARGAGSDPDSLQWLSRAIAPFVMRRTKKQVLTELPDKSEQVIYCEMSPKHRKLYNELRDHYRAQLSARIETEGLAKSKIIVLEALLRLRQAACHPGLLDAKAIKEPGPKLDELLERLGELTAEGHKTLVFSQFTSFLGIVKQHLKKQKIPFLYLDGQTSSRERERLVNQFQGEGKEPVFLISLKAGGSGLNLTAADYVFLLDPWWNPAVENQAIDRTHRIGQKSKVHACRLITKDTVEEKVLELQKKKKDLSEAILSIDGSLLRKLSWDDLKVLFE